MHSRRQEFPDFALRKISPDVEKQTGQPFGFPTWEINGKYYSGVQTLENLAKYSGYTGPRNFKNLE